MDYKDYYATLGVDKKASKDEIQKAYRKLARKYHPDVNTAEGAEDRFKEITEAYEVLKDQEKRQTYDQFGSNWKHAGGGAGGVPPGWQNVQFDFGGGGGSGFSSFFDMLFGGGRGAGGPAGGPGRGRGGDPFAGFSGGSPLGFDPAAAAGGRDLEMTLALTLEEAAAGGRRDITARDPNSGENLSFSVNLPPGVRQGQKIRLAGKGAAGANGQNGDLYLKVDFRPHPRFELDGHDLHVDLPVSPWHAALGGEASIKTLQGTLRVKVPPGSSTGRRIRLRGKGYPNPKGQDGDLYAKLKIMVPEKLTDRERALFEQLADESVFKPR